MTKPKSKPKRNPLNGPAWLEVDRHGLAELQRGKPKSHVLRELVANAFDEPIRSCKSGATYADGRLTVRVQDDSPEGFRNLRDAWTLFGSTPKRKEPTQRGRWNLGEKEAIAAAVRAEIRTTKGTVTFDDEGRHHARKGTTVGTDVVLTIDGFAADVAEIDAFARRIRPPVQVLYVHNGTHVARSPPLQVIETTLSTDLLVDGGLRRTRRKTTIDVLPAVGEAWLLEMGIPVCPIDCKYTLDVAQKVPLSPDRDSVPEWYLRDLYAEVLNATAHELRPEESSETWVHMASEDDRVEGEALQVVMKARYGDKVAVANPFDPVANDEALAQGYRLVHGSELSSAEWEHLRRDKILPSTTSLFGIDRTQAKLVEPTPGMTGVADFVRRLAQRLLGLDVRIEFVQVPGGKNAAYFEPATNTLTFVTNVLGTAWFDRPPRHPDVLDLVLHELGHTKGNHTEHAYHGALSRLGADAINLALDEPAFFRPSADP